VKINAEMTFEGNKKIETLQADNKKVQADIKKIEQVTLDGNKIVESLQLDVKQIEKITT
jgi:hypothetical protein